MMQGGMEEVLSVEGLELNLNSYRGQLQHVTELLAEDPSNSEYVEIKKGLREVIELTEEVLATTKQSVYSAQGADAPHLDPKQESQMRASSKQQPPDEPTYDRLPIGAKIQAIWSVDGEWYDATVERITSKGYYVVYDDWFNKEEVEFDNVRSREGGDEDEPANALVEAEKEAEATRRAIKRKIADAADAEHAQSCDLPAKFRIQQDDPEDVRAAKKRKIHAFKRKRRLEQLELNQNKRQNAWQQFQTAVKGRAQKVGFLKKESIFKSPEDPNGKVGVMGSGKGTTQFQKRENYLQLKKDGGEYREEVAITS